MLLVPSGTNCICHVWGQGDRQMKKLLFVFVMLAGLELIAAAGILVSSGTYDDSSRPAVGSGRRYGEYQGTPQGEIYIYKDHDPRFHIITDPVLTDNPVAYSGVYTSCLNASKEVFLLDTQPVRTKRHSNVRIEMVDFFFMIIEFDNLFYC